MLQADVNGRLTASKVLIVISSILTAAASLATGIVPDSMLATSLGTLFAPVAAQRHLDELITKDNRRRINATAARRV